MPDVKLKVKKEVSDLPIKTLADQLLLKTTEDFVNADIIDTLNDIGLIRAAVRDVEHEIELLAPQLQAIDTQIAALQTQRDALLGDRYAKINSYHSKIKEVLLYVPTNQTVGVDPQDVDENASRFIITPKEIIKYIPSPTYDMVAMLSAIPLLKTLYTFKVPARLTTAMEDSLNLAVTAGYLVREVINQSSLSDTSAAINRFNWDESLDIEEVR